MNRTDETETLLIILKKCLILPLTFLRLINLNLRLNLNLEHLKVLKNAEPLEQRCSFYLAVAFADAWVLRRAVARPCGAKLPRLKLDVEGTVVKAFSRSSCEKTGSHLDWIKGGRLSTGNRRGGTSCGFCASRGASRLVAGRTAQRKGHSPLVPIRGRFVSVETFQTAKAT